MSGHPKSLSLPEPAKYAISAMVVLAGVGLVLLFSLLRESNARVESDALIPLVDTVDVALFEGQLDLVVSGTVVPYREIKIGAEVSGRILKKYPECESGNFVTRGTKLLEIDPQDYHLEIKTMNGEILLAKRTLEETDEEIRGASRSLEIAQTDHKLQKKEYQRTQQLKSSLSSTEIDQSKRSLLNTESQLTGRQNTFDMLNARKERLKATLELAKNRLEKAELNLTRTIITAPVDGVIVRESVEQSDFVNVSDELLIFEDTSRAEVVCNLTPGELAWLRQHAPSAAVADQTQTYSSNVYQLPRVQVQIYDQADPEIKWSGVLERFDGIGRNEMTKSIPCRIVIQEPVVNQNGARRVLVRGMFVKCQAIVGGGISEIKLAALPADALQPDDYVWVVRDGKLKRLDVNVIDRTPVADDAGEKIVVVALGNEGLKPQDKVVITPPPQPTDDGRVLLREPVDKLAAPDNSGSARQASKTVHPDRSQP